MILIEGGGLRLEVRGLEGAGPELAFVASCTLCGLELSRREYDASVPGAGEKALAESTKDSYAGMQHVLQHQAAAL